MQGVNEPEVSWRERVSDKLSLATLVALSAAVVLSYFGTRSPPVVGMTTHVFVPSLVLLIIERIFKVRDFRVRAWLTIGVLLVISVAASAVVGMIGGTASAMFLALTLTALLFGQRVMLMVLALVAAAVGTIATLMVSGSIPPPLEGDVSFVYATTWLRTAGNTLVLLGLSAIAITQVVKELESVVGRVERAAKERERAQEERARALELALQSQKIEVVGRLAAGLAHDLNNALFVIDACNQTLQRGKLNAAERVETHNAIGDAVKQSSSMVRQLLSFARKHVVSPVPISTRELLDELHGSLTRLFPSDMKVVITCEEDVTVRADKVHLQQAILNLAINARDAMASGGELTVRAGIANLSESHPTVGGSVPKGRYAVLEVRDTGSGMDAVTQARAFEPLFTTKPEGKGTGLGLASVLSTVEMSGGHINFWSEPGRGTRFTLYFPTIEAEEPEEEAAPRRESVLDLRGTTVLLAEDSPQVRGVITSSLTEHGCTVLQARDGTEALDQINRTPSPIHVLCTDAVMPGVPVRDVLARLQLKHPETSVLVISGYITDELTRRGIEQGDYRVLAKPFGTQQLLETVADLRAGR